jgi:hypothetical protein
MTENRTTNNNIYVTRLKLVSNCGQFDKAFQASAVATDS